MSYNARIIFTLRFSSSMRLAKLMSFLEMDEEIISVVSQNELGILENVNIKNVDILFMQLF